ncbi:hypothetical protein RF55_10248 [Lasius niger]|uniref:Uncharacterized protein n=1 Tax=Lasius niger TaxID=67767 RepID=A0A0J7NBR0_LASNI|nr:hypothetical protein RF55_10248 [Lasius niger]
MKEKVVGYNVKYHRRVRDISSYGAKSVNNIFSDTGCAPVSSMKAIGPQKDGDSSSTAGTVPSSPLRMWRDLGNYKSFGYRDLDDWIDRSKNLEDRVAVFELHSKAS